MSEDTSRRSMTRRTRDFTVLIGTTGTVLLLLAATGALGLIEALSAFGVIASVAVAYFAGSAARVPRAFNEPAADPQAAGPVHASPALLMALPLPALEIGPGQKIAAYNRAADDLFQLTSLPFARASAVIRSP
ncbi:MAG: hypothetical protein KJ833_02115, partial [Alphaproteobacteria bacterium]|nr:hypothetical protein [Alphaproteobacteria bacterium]